MTDAERDQLVRQYAAGDIAWSTLRARGLDNYAELLEELGARGLRQPVAPLDGPNADARRRGRALIRDALQKVPT